MINEVKSESEFQEETKGGLVLVDVFTPPCGPCRQQIRILEGCTDLVKIVKVNAHELTDLAMDKLGIRAVPTLIWYKNGTEVKRTTGLQSEAEITRTVSELSDTPNMEVG